MNGYFECDACWKIKHTRHIMVFQDTRSGETHVWCDRCVKSMRLVARSMREIRSLIAGLIVSERIESRKQLAKPYRPMPKPPLRNPDPITPLSEPRVVTVFRKPTTDDFKVSAPDFAIRPVQH